MTASLNTANAFDVERIRKDFPALQQRINGHDLVYLDNGASAHKPQAVIDAITEFYATDYSNVHRGIHTLSQRATDRFEAARKTVQQYINAKSDSEIIFTSGTTAAINLVAHSFGHAFLQAGDEVLISAMEHHSNIVPWQLLAEQTGIVLKIIPMTQLGELRFEDFKAQLNDNTKLLAVTQLSNALGTITPIEQMIGAAHQVGAKVLVDGAQAIVHSKVDVQTLDCDFYAFSGHKVYGPTGVGVLYGKGELLEAMPPYQSGGEMIKEVSFDGSTYNEVPHKFEAGTPNIAGTVGLAAALDYLESIGMSAIANHEQQLVEYATQKLSTIDGLRIIGTAPQKAGVISFLIDDVHASDLGTLLDHQGIAVRVGHHCAMPAMDFFGVAATVRASFAMYNNHADVDALVAATNKALGMLR